MATEKKTSKKKSKGSSAVLATWGKRGLVAVVIGASLGAGAGVLTVNRLEPGRGTGVDSLAVMLDSIARGKVPTAGADTTQTQSKAPTPPVDSAPATELIAVPVLADMEEGAARDALLNAGLQVGEVQFQPSLKPAGTVLSTVPVAGSNVAPNTPIMLVLSDGRSAPPDTLSAPSSPASSSPSSSSSP